MNSASVQGGEGGMWSACSFRRTRSSMKPCRGAAAKTCGSTLFASGTATRQDATRLEYNTVTAASPAPATRTPPSGATAGLMRFTPGQILDHCEIVASLGEGAYAETYKARDTSSGATVVLKCPNPTLFADPALFQRYRRETEVAKRLDHPGVQRSLDL